MHEDKTNLLTVQWLPEIQGVRIGFEPTEFKSWDFILGVLEMAKNLAEARKREAHLLALQQQQAEAMQNNIIARQVCSKPVLRG